MFEFLFALFVAGTVALKSVLLSRRFDETMQSMRKGGAHLLQPQVSASVAGEVPLDGEQQPFLLRIDMPVWLIPMRGKRAMRVPKGLASDIPGDPRGPEGRELDKMRPA